MLVKIIDRAWYNNTLYDPDTSGEIIIEYRGGSCPTWAVPVEDKKEEQAEKVRVRDLPLSERNMWISKAKEKGYTCVLGWSLETLKKKIGE